MVINQLSANSMIANELEPTQRSLASVASLRDLSSDIAFNNGRTQTDQVASGATDQTSRLIKQQNIDNVEPIELNEKSLTQKMDELNVQLEKVNSSLRFEKDEDSEKMIIKIKNPETGEMIRQIPSKEFLAISNNISQFLEMQQLPDKVVMPKGLFANEMV